MRPHLLELEAFGAFPGRVVLDLDEIGQAGLVLLCGDTGGGKTTLLDALGFALYGVVPGERQKARDDLRSHHAPDTATARVRLTFTARGRRLRVARTPAQTRPKRRGTGTLTENPTALLESWDGQRWTPLAQRPEDVGLEIGLLLGMDATQFFQVVVLPQGRFAAFLQADHRDREKLLKQLFQVDRFERVELWLADRATRALEAVAAAGHQLDRLAARLAQAAGVEPPEDLEQEPDWAAVLTTEAAAAALAAGARTVLLQAERSVAERALGDEEALARRQAARRAADEEQARLQEQHPVMVALRAERDDADRARPVAVALDLADAAETAARHRAAAVDGARQALDGALARTSCPGGAAELWSSGGTDRELRQLADLLYGEDGRLEALGEVVERAAGERARHGAALQAAGSAEAELVAVRAELGTAPARRAAAQRQQDLARAAAQELPAARLAHEQALQQAALRAEHAQVEGLLVVARQRAGQLHGEVERARALAREVRNDRVDALIGRLARSLEDDTPCPVCGSLFHPDASELVGQDVGEEAERRAEAAAEAAGTVAAAAHAELARLEERRSGVAARLLPEAPDVLRAVQEVDRCALLAGAEPAARAELEELHAAVAQATGQVARLEELIAQNRSRAAEAAVSAATLTARLTKELGVAVDLADRRAQVTAAARSAAEVAEALTARAGATDAAEQALARAAELLASSGFADRAAVLAAGRPVAWSVAATQRLDDHLAAVAGVQALTAELDVAMSPAADVAGRTVAARTAAAAHEEAVADERVLSDRAVALERLAPDVAAALAALGPLRSEASDLKGLADVAAGRGTNRLSMPLSTYVLAARLEEVAEAASQRLGRMSGGRYSLSHTDVGRDRRSRAGLGLQVDDGWTGRSRDTATLSGGETFMTALSLALGLADVVTAESGGRTIDALFVDEGFGTLDAGSLDQVMDVLDELRSGGRLVGVVSHVADLKLRIPAQVHVVRGTAGSSVEVR